MRRITQPAGERLRHLLHTSVAFMIMPCIILVRFWTAHRPPERNGILQILNGSSTFSSTAIVARLMGASQVTCRAQQSVIQRELGSANAEL